MKHLFYISLLIICFHAVDAQAADWYVKSSGGSGSGTSWTAAWNGMDGINWGHCFLWRHNMGCRRNLLNNIAAR